jgi:beta-lactamase regulating signal transducer with metallopeptidase domain
MTSTPALGENRAGEPERLTAAPRGINVAVGFLWIVGIAGAWIVVLVLFHNLMARLLS